MKLIDNWKRVLRYGWSIRLIVLAGLLQGLDMALPYFDSTVPKGWFGIVSLIVTAAAFITRIVAQPKVHGHE